MEKAEIVDCVIDAASGMEVKAFVDDADKVIAL